MITIVVSAEEHDSSKPLNSLFNCWPYCLPRSCADAGYAAKCRILMSKVLNLLLVYYWLLHSTRFLYVVVHFVFLICVFCSSQLLTPRCFTHCTLFARLWTHLSTFPHRLLTVRRYHTRMHVSYLRYILARNSFLNMKVGYQCNAPVQWSAHDVSNTFARFW
jgi:hypothetical protein